MTSNSKLKLYAEKIARQIAAFERGEKMDVQFMEKLIHAREHKTAAKIGIVMNDKIITLEIPWQTIKESGEVALTEYIFNLMKDKRNTMH